jgi:NADP-dependent 3-hydroxy acid dehydrogenase YdfG
MQSTAQNNSTNIARAVAFAISQTEDVDVDEILYRPTRQEP